MARQSLFAVVLLALVAGAGVHQVAAPGSTGALPTAVSGATSSANTAVGAPAPTAVEKTQQEWQAEGLASIEDTLRQEICTFAEGGNYCTGEGFTPLYPGVTKVMLAILPDPIHTSLALNFDRAVDAVEYGLQDRGWYLDRQWLPWSWIEPAEKTEEKNLPDQVSGRFYRKGFEEQPGVILFRRSENEPAWKTAMKAIRRWCCS